MRLTWLQPEDLIRHELWQSTAEGREVFLIKEHWLKAGGTLAVPHSGSSAVEETSEDLRNLAKQLLLELENIADPMATDEPSDWNAIAKDLPAIPVGTGFPANFRDRLNAAWLGRAIGCVLGKPVEKIPRNGIEEILRSAKRWPLDSWITAIGVEASVTEKWPWNRASKATSLAENIAGTPEDDDINYTIMALRVLEKCGRKFSSSDVAEGWLLDLPAGRSFTAERIAYRNLLLGYVPPMTARVQNPFREWIGAQIRVDLYGWVNPGNPVVAAEYAWRDAAVSHTRNGIYSAMFVAAMTSSAITGTTIEQVLETGSAVVPKKSRIYAAINFGRELAERETEPVAAFQEIEKRYQDHHWVHSLNNTALISYALAAGGGDFSRSICLTVMGGLDTDSNGATVGGIVGALTGTVGIESRWQDPLQNRITTSIPGENGLSFDQLADRTYRIAVCSETETNTAPDYRLPAIIRE